MSTVALLGVGGKSTGKGFMFEKKLYTKAYSCLLVEQELWRSNEEACNNIVGRAESSLGYQEIYVFRRQRLRKFMCDEHGNESS